MKISLSHISLISLLSNPWAATALESNSYGYPQSLTETICANTQGRPNCEVELDVPSACVTDGESDCPIVFFLHGSGGTNNSFASQSKVHNVGFIGVYPQGEGGWNTGPKDTNSCPWDDFDCTQDPDEGKFIASIIAEIRASGGSGNVYAIGNSNGAALAHRLASNAGEELPIKGIVAKVTQLLLSPERSGPGALNYNQPTGATPAVSVLSVMGTNDGLIPYEGGSSAVFGGDENFQLMSALGSMQTWASHNGCDGSNPATTEHSSTKGDSATKYEYSGCPSGVIVEHYAIHGGEHNAGGTEIDGVKVDYDLAFEFINRVESGDGGGGGGEPTSPVASPVASPTTSESCVNDPSWHGKFSADHDCDYVAQNPDNRCRFQDDEGTLANDACPAACDASCLTDDSISSPVTSPVASPTASESCVNNPTWHGKFSADHDCDYVAQNPDNRCRFQDDEGTLANDACPAACDNSCLTDDSISSPVASPVTEPTSECEDDATWAGKFNTAHDCDYVAQNPDNRCGWENSEGVSANDACPVACNIGCARRGLRKRYLRNRI